MGDSRETKIEEELSGNFLINKDRHNEGASAEEIANLLVWHFSLFVGNYLF